MKEHKKIAKWLYDKIIIEHYIDQRTVVYDIEEKFGENFIYINKNGNPAIDAEVLEEFRKLKKNDIIWDQHEQAWHTNNWLSNPLEQLTEGLPKLELPKLKP